MTLIEMGKNAKLAAGQLMTVSTLLKNSALEAIADALIKNTDIILDANKKDTESAKARGISESMLDRLTLTSTRIASIADATRQVASLPDPVGQVDSTVIRPNGLKISRVRVPLGVIGMIFEARPNVTVDAAVLCLKSGNAVILRGGSEAIHSNIALTEIMQNALEKAGLSRFSVQIISDTSRETAKELMRLNGYIDLLIPRGGAGLIRTVVENATVPVVETGVGNCHVYIDEHAQIDMGVNIIYNAKTSRPSVCNAAETLLVHKNIAEQFLPKAYEKLCEKNVEIRGCSETVRILGNVKPATDTDYETEFLDYVLAVKVVDSVDEAILHIKKYSSGHSECIVTDSYPTAEHFLSQVDAAAVYLNASTRFTDGGEFGLGAEIGISTQKMHVRGPMGLTALTSIKHIIYGNGQIR